MDFLDEMNRCYAQPAICKQAIDGLIIAIQVLRRNKKVGRYAVIEARS